MLGSWILQKVLVLRRSKHAEMVQGFVPRMMVQEGIRLSYQRLRSSLLRGARLGWPLADFFFACADVVVYYTFPTACLFDFRISASMLARIKALLVMVCSGIKGQLSATGCQDPSPKLHPNACRGALGCKKFPSPMPLKRAPWESASLGGCFLTRSLKPQIILRFKTVQAIVAKVGMKSRVAVIIGTTLPLLPLLLRVAPAPQSGEASFHFCSDHGRSML